MKNLITIIKKSKISSILIGLCFLSALVSSFLAVVPIQFIGFTISVISGDINSNNFIVSTINKIYPSLEKYELAFLGIGLFFTFSFISIIFRNIFCYYASIISDKIIVSIREQLYFKLLKMDFMNYLEKEKGDIIYTIISDTQRLQYIFSDPFYTLFSDLFDLIWITVFLLLVDPILVILLVIIIPLLYLASFKTAKLQKEIAEEIQNIDSSLTAKIDQTLLGFETIKAFNGEECEGRIFSDKTRESFRFRKQASKSLSLFFPIEGMLRVVGICIILIYAIYKIQAGYMVIGMLAILFQYANQFYSPIRNVSRYYQTMQAGLVSVKRIIDFFNIPEEKYISNPESNKEKTTGKNIKFEKVSFKIKEKLIFSNLSIDCSQGDFVLVKGNSGCGKTSLLRIVLGLCQMDDGNITINDNNINLMNKKELRKRISYVGQDVFLHNDSVLRNLSYPDKECKDIKIVNDTLQSLNLTRMDLNYVVGEQGQNLSGGERRRVAIARALLRDSEIMILDEITAGLDIENEDLVVQALERIKGMKTILLVSHSNNEKILKLADKIININGNNTR